MTYTEQAIRKAIERGYSKLREPITFIEWKGSSWMIRTSDEITYPIEVLFLDPSFWQSLGKALGWCPDDNWKWYWHNFIDNLIAGKDTETFFKDLLQ